jgi:DNA-binding MarR family transcriptional regulator
MLRPLRRITTSLTAAVGKTGAPTTSSNTPAIQVGSTELKCITPSILYGDRPSLCLTGRLRLSRLTAPCGARSGLDLRPDRSARSRRCDQDSRGPRRRVATHMRTIFAVARRVNLRALVSYDRLMEDQLQQRIDRAFRNPPTVLSALARIYDEALDAVGTTPTQHRVLGYCALAPATPTELADWLAVTRQGVTRPIETLVSAGLLRREPHHADGRQALLYITASGQDRLDETNATVDRYLAFTIDMLGSTRADSVRDFFELLGVALRAVWVSEPTQAHVRRKR